MYLWWRTWHDNDRRLWAERFTAGDPAEAKQRHRDDLTFTWAGRHRRERHHQNRHRRYPTPQRR